MYPITSEVMALFEAEHRKVLRITGTDKNGTAIIITDDNVLADSFQIDRYCCNGEKLEIGTAIAAQMTFRLFNTNGQFDGVVFEGTELTVEIGIADWTQASATVTYVPCGLFTPDIQPRRMATISLTCLDRMTKFDVAVDAAALTFPTTVAGLVGQACTLCGVALAEDIAAMPNASVSIAELPAVQGTITYRNLIQWCAGIMAANAWFDWNGELRFSWYDKHTGYVSTTDNRYSSDLYENDLALTGVVYTNASGIEIVEGTDDYALDMTGNALAGPMVATVLPAINAAVNGFTYRPFEAAVVNAPYLWPMDVVTFTDKDGNDHVSVLTNVAFGVNGTTALESKGMTEAINKLQAPAGVTKEQAQFFNKITEQVDALSETAVAGTTVLYASGASATDPPGDGWSTTPPEHRDGWYVWQKVVTLYADGRSVTSEAVNISGADGADATVLRIDSSRGTVFKNNQVSTVLSVAIYHGPDRITDTTGLARVFGPGAYLQWSWQRMGEDRYGIISSDDSRIGEGGFTFTLSPADVDTKVTFMCELIVN